MFEMVAKTLFGIEEVLAEELKSLGAGNVRLLNRAVAFSGDRKLLYKANYSLRTALKILVPLVESEIGNENELYGFVRTVPWDKYMGVNDTLAVEATLKSDLFTHSQFVAQRIKDAIVDQFRDKYGQRPSVDLDQPSLRINAFLSNKIIKLSLDSSGDPLYRRGYRISQGPAPLNEVLAAGLIKLSGWNGLVPFVDFMCGSGTLPIEAALIAGKIPPGAMGRTYGFQKWNDYDARLFRDIEQEHKHSPKIKNAGIFAADISSQAVGLATRHAHKAGVGDIISFKNCHLNDFLPPPPPGLVIINPPYGERVITSDIDELYAQIGNRLKKAYSGFDAWIFSGNAEAAKHIGLRPSRKIPLYNGQLECRFYRYSLYEGTKKIHKTIHS